MTPNTISYISGGYLGDFFFQLCVICENYKKFGKKGILYITDLTTHFRKPVDVIYRETFDIIQKQNYIAQYKIYKNEPYDIDLGSWRQNYWDTSLLNMINVAYNLKLEGQDEHKWLDLPTEERWQNTILINTVLYRPYANIIDYQRLKSKYNTFKFIFISNEKVHYDQFIVQTQQNDIEYYCPISLLDASIAINSCYFCICVPSGLCSIANACQKRTVIVSVNHPIEHQNNINLDKIGINVTYDYKLENSHYDVFTPLKN